MDAARLLYGELELNASSALFAVDQLDEGFDILADQIVETQDGLGGLDNSLIESSEATNALSGSFESLGQSLSVIGIFMILAGVLYELISSSESFKKVIIELQKAFEPLLKVIGEFAEWVGKYIAEALLFVISLLSEFINYLLKQSKDLHF